MNAASLVGRILTGLGLAILVCAVLLTATSLSRTKVNIAALEQTVIELRVEVEDLQAQQQEGLRSALGCVGDEAVCFIQHEEENINGYPGRRWVETWCCEGPER